MSKFYLTTAIAYVNGSPHIGFALELVQADALARYYRLKGDDTYFLTGTDEHGVKIYETAKEKGVNTQNFVDENAKKFEDLKGILNLTNDDFIRTSSDLHKRGAQKIWMKMFEKGDIYKGAYKGNYCVGCESFIPEKDLDENGFCPNHMKKPELLEEENYFFKLSAYSEQIKSAIETDELKVVPECRKNEILNIIGEDGLHDVSFSRPVDQLPWGVPVPNDESQVMYVWCDALSNYISAIGYENETEQFKKYWPCDAHIIGKDILRFHAGIWIGMLYSAGLELPKSIYVHGFITSEGQKMSKSLGNVVDPLEYVEKYGDDAFRYYLLREISTTDDGDFSRERFESIYNSELANGVGNLVNRVIMMTERYLDAKVPNLDVSDGFGQKLEEILEKYKDSFERFDIKFSCEQILKLLDFANKYTDDKKPWALAKEEKMEELTQVLYDLLQALKYVTVMLLPLIPKTAEKIAGQLSLDIKNLSFDLKSRGYAEDAKVEKADLLFPKLDV